MSVNYRKMKDEWKQQGRIPEWYSSNALQFFMETYSYEGEGVEAAAKGLFAGLRALDEAAIDVILVPTFPEEGLGVAYMNRLKKATNQLNFLEQLTAE